MEANALEIRGVSKSFGSNRVLADLDLSLRKVEIYEEINALARGGLPVIMYSSELLELIGMCDRVVVIRGGKVSAILSGGDLTEETILEKALTS